MATVDGITVAAADVIDKKHIAAMSVVGGDLVLTRENLATLSTPLPTGGGGGGTPLGQSETWAFNPPRKTSGGEPGLIITGLNWTALSNADGGTLAPGVSIGTDGKLLLAEGWYEIVVYIELRFFVSTVNPDYVRCAFDCGNTIMGNCEVWPPLTAYRSAGADFKAVSHMVNLGPIYSDGTAFLRPQLNWGMETPDYDTPSSTSLGAQITQWA